MAQATHLYFDHPYEPDPEERGYYWAPRFTDTRKTFGFMPEDLYGTADVARSGDPILYEDLCGENGKKCVPLLKPENIAGMFQSQCFLKLCTHIVLKYIDCPDSTNNVDPVA